MSLTDAAVRLPDPNAGFDYQLGGPYPPPPGATIVERDRTARPAGAGYDICYVNGFQTQPAESADFEKRHPDLVVRRNGQPVVDPEWKDEYILDTSTEVKRNALAGIVKPWIDGCKTAGYAAVEIDNLDSYLRSRGALSAENNVAMAQTYAQIAHAAGLAIAQKNAAEQVTRLRAVGYDFAVAESCFKFEECASYTEHYPVVLDVEYTKELDPQAFPAACASTDRAPVMIMRDYFLVTPGDHDYFYKSCAS